MKFAVKAEDGNYMRFPRKFCINYTESDWNATSLEDAELFLSEERARDHIQRWGFGKWGRAKCVPILVSFCDQSEIVSKPTSRFLFIANKPSSVDYCRGRLMAYYDSDYIMENMLTAEKLVMLWAKYIRSNMNLSCNEAGYEIRIFKDGIQVWSQNYSTRDGDWDLEAQELLGREINDLFQKAKSLAEEIRIRLEK